ncbi:MAG: hypothetical protein ACD_60C00004G0008 [uncultured bacterium]|nr:MAG: hypothetical protein ACD_60C00004G0008 [uncultured bacterium]
MPIHAELITRGENAIDFVYCPGEDYDMGIIARFLFNTARQGSNDYKLRCVVDTITDSEGNVKKQVTYAISNENTTMFAHFLTLLRLRLTQWKKKSDNQFTYEEKTKAAPPENKNTNMSVLANTVPVLNVPDVKESKNPNKNEKTTDVFRKVGDEIEFIKTRFDLFVNALNGICTHKGTGTNVAELLGCYDHNKIEQLGTLIGNIKEIKGNFSGGKKIVLDQIDASLVFLKEKMLSFQESLPNTIRLFQKKGALSENDIQSLLSFVKSHQTVIKICCSQILLQVSLLMGEGPEKRCAVGSSRFFKSSATNPSQQNTGKKSTPKPSC